MKQISLALSTFSFVTSTIALPIQLSITSPVLAQTAGCGSGWTNTVLKVASVVGSNQFRVACDEHDACYDTFGKSKQECDKAFHNRILGICARDHNTMVGTFLRRTCNGRADAYYAAVRERGDKFYEEAQKNANGGGMLGGSERRNNWSGKCLQTMGQENANGSTVNIWDCTNSSNQFWTLTSKGELRNNRSGKCLQTMGQEKANGSTVNIWDCTNSSNQFWERTSNGEFRNQRSGKCLQTMGQEKANGSTVNIWDCTNSSNQSWR